MRVKVLDFGIARLREVHVHGTATASHASLGTPAFMPPEQARGRTQEVDARTDLWALGATMFHLLSGRHVHEAATVNEQLLAAMTNPAPPLQSVAPGVPSTAARVVDRALAFDKADRWGDAREMQLAVREAYRELTGQPIAEAPPLVPVEPDRESLVEEAGPMSETLPADGAISRTTGRSMAAVRQQATTGADSRRTRVRWILVAAACVGLGAPAAFLLARTPAAAPPSLPVAAPGSSAPAGAPAKLPSPVASAAAALTTATVAPSFVPVPAARVRVRRRPCSLRACRPRRGHEGRRPERGRAPPRARADDRARARAHRDARAGRHRGPARPPAVIRHLRYCSTVSHRFPPWLTHSTRSTLQCRYPMASKTWAIV